MLHTISMPKLSPTMTEGVIAKWHKKPGDKIEAGDVLLEISTDKATVEHNALDPGWMREILIEEGAHAEVGIDLALVTDEAKESYTFSKTEEKKEALTLKEPKKSIGLPSPSPLKTDRILVSPLAKKIAKDAGIDLQAVRGTGPQGRIMSRDLPQVPPSAHAQTAVIKTPLTPMRRTIAERLSYSKRHIPHFYVREECDLTDLVRMREQLKEAQYTFTINDFIVRATALSLMEHPALRSSYDEKEQVVVQYPDADISVAVSVEGGLITPILFQANKKSLSILSTEMKRLAEKARNGKLSPEEYTGGCFTISNLGMFGIPEFQAIVNPPQAAILAVGAAQDGLKMIDGRVDSRKLLKLTLSVDHRVVDGEKAARFMQTLKHYLERPILSFMT